MGDAAGVLLDGRLLLVVAVLGLGAVAAGPLLAERLRVSQPHVFGLALSTGVILAMTLLNRAGGPFDVARLVRWETYRWYEFHRPDYLMNVALFVPAAAFWTAAVRRPVWVLLGGALLSLLIEAAQSVFRLGTGDQADLVANTLGTLIGVTAGWAWRRLHPAPEPHGWSHRQAVVATVALALAAAAGVFAIGVEVQRRADRVTEVLTGSLGPATTDDLSSVLTLDEADALAHFTTTLGVEADAIAPIGSDRYVVRYPIEFLGARRCVFAEITPDGTTFRQDTGGECDVSPTAALRARATAPRAR